MLRGQKSTLPPVKETEEAIVETLDIPAKSNRPGLRRRNQSAKLEESSQSSINLRDELRMRFWSLQHDTAQSQTDAAAVAGELPALFGVWRSNICTIFTKS